MIFFLPLGIFHTAKKEIEKERVVKKLHLENKEYQPNQNQQNHVDERLNQFLIIQISLNV